MKKRLTAILASACALAILTTGATLAFFTDESGKTNTFTMGSLAVSLTETTDSEKATQTPEGIFYQDVLPGDQLSKRPVVHNTGETSAWVRVSLTVTGSAAAAEDQQRYEAELAQLRQALVEEMTAGEAPLWAVKDGQEDYLYCTVPLQPGEEAVLFEQVSIPAAWGTESAGGSFRIAVDAQAVQQVNNGKTWDSADWSADVAEFTSSTVG